MVRNRGSVSRLDASVYKRCLESACMWTREGCKSAEKTTLVGETFERFTRWFGRDVSGRSWQLYSIGSRLTRPFVTTHRHEEPTHFPLSSRLENHLRLHPLRPRCRRQFLCVVLVIYTYKRIHDPLSCSLSTTSSVRNWINRRALSH